MYRREGFLITLSGSKIRGTGRSGAKFERERNKDLVFVLAVTVASVIIETAWEGWKK